MLKGMSLERESELGRFYGRGNPSFEGEKADRSSPGWMEHEAFPKGFLETRSPQKSSFPPSIPLSQLGLFVALTPLTHTCLSIIVSPTRMSAPQCSVL